jgi:hypothetical protein
MVVLLMPVLGEDGADAARVRPVPVSGPVIVMSLSPSGTPKVI